jgi:RHS repeat-associated protein
MKRMSWVLLVGLIALFFTLPKSVLAQGYFYQYGNQPWTTPIPVPGGYMDAANGNLHIEIPIASIAERGHVPFLAKLVYDSHIWTRVLVNQSYTWQPVNVGGQPAAWGGWRLVTSVGTGGGVNYLTGSGVCYTRVGTINVPHYYTTYGPFTWTAPDGHLVPFGGIQTNRGNTCMTASTSFDSIATDASGYHIYVTNYTSAVVYAPDGTQMFPNVKDTNGNFYSAPNSNGDVIDTLGRTPITTTVNGSTITYAVLNSQGSSYNIVVTTESIPVNTSFGQSGVTECSTNCTVTVVQSIALPDGTSYQFGYDQGSTGVHYGTLTSVTLPTSTTVSYTYTYTNFKDAYNNQNLYLTSCSAGSGTWSYSPTVISSCGTTCSQKVTVTQPSSDQEQYTFTMYNGQMWDTLSAFYSGSVSPSNLLRSVAITYNTSNPPYIQPTTYVTTVPTPSGNLSSQTTITWDTTNLGNVMNVNAWKFYPGTFPPTADRTTSYTYLTNSDNNMVNKKASVSVGGTSTTINYDSYGSGQPTVVSGASGHDDTNFGESYTARGNPTSIVTGFGTTTLTYDTTGQVLSVTDPDNNQTTLSYADNFYTDSGTPPIGSGANAPSAYTPSQLTNAFVKTITLPLSGSITLGFYYGSGKLAIQTDQNSVNSVFHYLDGQGWDRPSTSYLPGGEWMLNNYTSATQFDTYKGITDVNASTSCSSCVHNQTTVDSLGRLHTNSLVSDPEGADTVTVAYDSSGRVLTTTNPERSTSSPTDGTQTFGYDGMDRVTQITDQDSSVAKTYYGTQVSTPGGNSSQLCASSTYGSGYPILYVDEAGKMRQTWSDGFGRIMEVDEPDPANSNHLDLSTCYQYNNLNNKLLQVAQGTQTRSYSYDSLYRITSATTPESGRVNYYYTTSGGLLCSGNPAAVCRRTDARSTTTTYTYDKLNRLTGKTYSDSTPAVSYFYDQSSANGLTISYGLGRLTSMSDGSGTAAWSYYANGLVQTEKRTIATITNTLSYTYSEDGSLTSITYPSGRTITYNVGNAEQAIWAKDVANSIQYAAAASYAPIGAVNSVLYGQVSGGFNGITETRAYNSRLEFNTIAASSSAGTAENLTYNYNLPTGNNVSVNSISNGVNSGLSESFTYDSLNRILTGATTSNSATGCWGDSFGASGIPDDPWSNLTQINVTQCTGGSLSASAGSTTNQLALSGVTSPYDLAGNMVKDGSYTYTFDAENHILTASGMSGGPWNYVYDGDGLRVEKSNGSTGTIYWRAVTGEAIAETDLTGSTTDSAYKEYVFFAGRRIAWHDSSGNVYFYYADHLGSNTVITTGNGTPCYQATFTPYGEEHLAQTTTCTQNYKFTGYERDTETGLDYAFFRYYNSRLGRFMSADPIGGDVSNPQTLNRYAYVTNKPTNMIDPLGLHCAVGFPCPQQAFDPSAFPAFMANALWIDWGLGLGTWPGGDAPQSPLPGALLLQFLISFEMFGGNGQGQQGDKPKTPPVVTAEPLSGWQKVVLTISCIFGLPPDYAKPIEIDQKPPEDSTDTPEGHTKGQRSVQPKKGKIPPLNPTGGISQTPDPGIAQAASDAVVCIYNVFNAWPTKKTGK